MRTRDGYRVMTVVDVYPAVFRYRYRCSWTDSEGIDHIELFKASELEPADLN